MMHPAPPPSSPFLIAIVDLLGFKSHLCSEDGTPIPKGLEQLYEKYTLLLDATRRSALIDGYQLNADSVVEHIKTSVRHVIMSDTILFWSAEQQASYLVIALANLMNLGMVYGVPLRGAISYGHCIIDAARNMFLGQPIIEALNAEKVQEWIGIGILQSAVQCLAGTPGISNYEVPIKANAILPGGAMNHAVAWHLADDTPNGPEIRLNRMMAAAGPRSKVKYENALLFVRNIGP